MINQQASRGRQRMRLAFFLRSSTSIVPCEQFVWRMLQALILAISLNYHGNSCRTLDLVMKVEILNKIKKGDVSWTNKNAVLVLFLLFVYMEVRLIQSVLQSRWATHQWELTQNLMKVNTVTCYAFPVLLWCWFN